MPWWHFCPVWGQGLRGAGTAPGLEPSGASLSSWIHPARSQGAPWCVTSIGPQPRPRATSVPRPPGTEPWGWCHRPHPSGAPGVRRTRMRPAGTRTTGTRTCQGHLGTPCTTGEPPQTNPAAPRPPRGCAALLPRATKGGDKKPPASPQSHPNQVPPPQCHRCRSPLCRAHHRAPRRHRLRPLVPPVPRDTHVVTPAPVGTLRPGGLRCAAGAQPKLQQAFFRFSALFLVIFFLASSQHHGNGASLARRCPAAG